MSEFNDNSKVFVVVVTKGIVDAKMRMAMRHDARGSHPLHPVHRTRRVDPTTASEPSASAMIWR